MTKEQEEAIEMLEDIKNNSWTTKYIMSSDSAKAETVLNMLKEKDREIEHQIEKRNNQKAELAILNEKQKEMNRLINTVSSYKGMLKKEQKDNKEKDKEIERLEKQSKNLDKQAQQYFEQTIYLDKQIDLMADFIYKIWCDYPGSIFHKLKEAGFDESKCGFCEHSDRMCKDCLKQYFERKEKEC